MGVIQDITDVMKTGPKLAAQMNSLKLNTKSITRAAKDSTFQFPVLIVDTVPIDKANTTMRLLDHIYATFTQTVLSMHSMFDISVDPTPLSHLRSIHQNMKLESTLDELTVDREDYDKYMEKVYDGSYRLYMNKDKSFGILFNESMEIPSSLGKKNRELLRDHLSDFNMKPIEINEALDSAGGSSSVYDMTTAIIDGEIEKNRRDRVDMSLRQSDRGHAPKLLDRDVKRSNDMVPYGLETRLIALNDKKEFVQYIDIVVGVKAIMHPVSSDDMVENIVKALQNKSFGFKFLRWTSGEISLVKDLILGMDDLKFDARNRASGRSPFFGTLKRLKDRKLKLKNFTVPYAILPNTSIVLTSYEVEFIEKNFAINLRKDVIAKKLMQSLFLISIIIIDEGTETLEMIQDGDSTYQTYSLDTLERSNDLNSNKLGREIGRMISR